MNSNSAGGAPAAGKRAEGTPEVVWVHLGYKRSVSRNKSCIDTRCGTGDRKSITWTLAECTCPLCLYWAKRGYTEDTWREIWQ